MKKLSNERFVQSAPEKVVANERAKQADAEAKIAAIREQLERSPEKRSVPKHPFRDGRFGTDPRSGRGGMPRHKTQTADVPETGRADGIRTARENLPAITIYTDGSALGNPGPGGYGAVLLAGPHRKELSQVTA